MPESYPTHLWEPVKIPANENLLFKLGQLSVRIDSADEELRFQASRDANASHDPGVELEPGHPAPSADDEFFACSVETPVIQAKPVMPDRSVVIRPGNHVSVLPGEQALFYVGLPIWIQFELVRSKPVVLKTLPVVTRSATWYGDPMSGEHCYVEKSLASRVLQRDGICDWQAVCPITIHNQARTSLEVARLCVQVSHLGVYQGHERLWTQPVAITNREGPDPMEVRYGQSPPDSEPIVRALSDPRDPARKSLLGRGLSTLRLPGF